MIAAMAAAAFVAGVLVSCAPTGGQAPQPVPPVQTGSYTIGNGK